MAAVIAATSGCEFDGDREALEAIGGENDSLLILG